MRSASPLLILAVILVLAVPVAAEDPQLDPTMPYQAERPNQSSTMSISPSSSRLRTRRRYSRYGFPCRRPNSARR